MVKRNFTFKIDDAVRDELRKLADERDTTLTALIEEGIYQVLGFKPISYEDKPSDLEKRLTEIENQLKEVKSAIPN